MMLAQGYINKYDFPTVSPSLSLTRTRRARAPSRGGVRMRASLKQGIAEFYDESSTVWEDIWGEHMHHGYYDEDEAEADHRAAQIRMIQEALRFAGVTSASRVLDVGCGIGGSSRYIAKALGATCEGVTLSPVQARRGNALAAEQGMADKARFAVGDALELPFEDAAFDLVWSMESGEHMPDKAKFAAELARVAAPGGSVVVVTWCHREVDQAPLLDSDRALLDRICRAFFLPAWCPASHYVSLFQSLGLSHIHSADWTARVAPFWPAVIRSALSWSGLTSLLFKAGWKTIKGALAMPLMIQGYNKGLIKFVIITARKP